MNKERKTFFIIGIFNPNIDSCWPWSCRPDDGVYLSENNRRCGVGKAICFDTPKEARLYFHDWIGNKAWKMELVKMDRLVEISSPIYPPDHPFAILKLIQKSEIPSVRETARVWFSGEIKNHYITKVTLKRHRDRLLAYGIDIYNKPPRVI